MSNVHISPRSKENTFLRGGHYDQLKQRQGGVIFAGQHLTDPLRKKRIDLNRVGKVQKEEIDVRASFLFDCEKDKLNDGHIWAGTAIDRALNDTQEIIDDLKFRHPLDAKDEAIIIKRQINVLAHGDEDERSAARILREWFEDEGA